MTPAGANNNNNNFTKISSDSSHHACCWSLGVCCVSVYVCVVVITDTRIVIRCAHFQGNFSNKRKTKPIFTDKWSKRGSGECRLYQVFGICVLPFSVAMTTLKWADLRHYLLIKRLAKRIPLPLFPSSIPSCFCQHRRQCQCWQTAMGYSQGRDRVPAWSRLAFN